MPDSIQQIINYVLTLVAGSTVVGLVTWQLFKIFSERWLESKFKRSLAHLQHEHQRELEQMKFEINALFDRKVKLHQREFEVLPRAWELLNDAQGHVVAFTSSLQSYPNLDKLPLPRLQEFLADSQLSATERADVMDADRKVDRYSKIIFWHRLSDCRERMRELRVFLDKSAIFMPDDIRESFSKLDTLIWDALVEHQMNEEMAQTPRLRDKQKALSEQSSQLTETLQAQLKKRMWSE